MLPTTVLLSCTMLLALFDGELDIVSNYDYF